MINLNELNEPQQEAVAYGDGPLLILAGAGSGKTRVITYRIAYLLEKGVAPWNILAVTFTNKAANEMRERIFKLTAGRGTGVWVSTFHSFCAQFLRMEGSHFGIDKAFTIYDQNDQKKVIKECLAELSLDEKKMSCGVTVDRISREKDQLMDAESFAISAAASGDPNKELLSSIYLLYDQKMKKSGALDFGDLILKTVELLQTYPTLREKFQERFRYVLVDEYQDTNRAQYVLTKILAMKHKNICVVGDDDQSIYSWRGADIRNILDFEKDYDDVKVIKLEQNYRSTEPILNASWNLIQNNRLRKEKKLWTERKSESTVESEVLENEWAEAESISEKVKEWSSQNKMPLSHFAVFYRTNAQSRVLEDAFRRNQIPYLLVGNVRFYERAEVKDVLAYLKVIVNPKDHLSFKRILNCPPRGIGKNTLEILERMAIKNNISLYETLFLNELFQSVPSRAKESLMKFRNMTGNWMKDKSQCTVFALLKKILAEIRMIEILQEEAVNDYESAARLDNVQELLNAAEEFEEKSENKSVDAYLEQVSLMTELDVVEDKKNAVTLMTVHIAKGLEFPVVFLTGLEEGLFPLGESQFSEKDLEEERRLAYVGMTRAKDRLFLTAASSRKLFGQTHWNVPSRFIQEAGVKIKLFDESPQEHKNYPVKPMEYSGKSVSQFRIGQRVRHADFGVGKIAQKSGDGDDLKVVVEFESGQWKKLLVKYAPLQKL